LVQIGYDQLIDVINHPIFHCRFVFISAFEQHAKCGIGFFKVCDPFLFLVLQIVTSDFKFAFKLLMFGNISYRNNNAKVRDFRDIQCSNLERYRKACSAFLVVCSNQRGRLAV